MKINRIEYRDAETGLEIRRLEFNGLTLLVGLTGVGKTGILNIICLFPEIAFRRFTGICTMPV